MRVQPERTYTYHDYLSWPEDRRWEIIDGQAYDMSPAPSTAHQRVVLNLVRLLAEPAAARGCEVFVAPTDVVLDERNVVQPDLLVVCDPVKVTEQAIRGAPDLIAEVLSPSTELKDRRAKRALYERFGVREYVLLHVAGEYLERYSLQDGRYGIPELFNWDERLALTVLDGLSLDLRAVFQKPMGT
jgi:Uma2 family endonuclease